MPSTSKSFFQSSSTSESFSSVFIIMNLIHFFILVSFLTCMLSIIQAQITSSLLNVANTTTAPMRTVVETYQSPTLTVIDALKGDVSSGNNNENIRSSSFVAQRRPSVKRNFCGDYFTYRSVTFGLTDTYGLVTIRKPDRQQNIIRVVITVAKKLNPVSIL